MFRKNLQFAIVGGSIAGNAAARLLSEAGHQVKIFEKTSQPLQQRGAGIGISAPHFNQHVARGLLSPHIPRIVIPNRRFLLKDESAPDGARLLWQQELSLLAFNWANIYEDLSRAITSRDTHIGTRVTQISSVEDGCVLQTNQGQFEADMVLGCDGIGSIVRESMGNQARPEFANYVIFRGLCDNQDFLDHPMFKVENGAPMCMFQGGHFLAYPIPANDYAYTGKFLINWGIYAPLPAGVSLQQFLTDKEGMLHEYSLPPGSLSKTHVAYMNSLATTLLPPIVAQMIAETKAPFIQAIYDGATPQHRQGRLCILGDAAAVNRPHSAHGVTSALESAMTFALALTNHDVSAALDRWNDEQLAKTKTQTELSRRFGAALVTDSPQWSMMCSRTMPEWWASVLAGKEWLSAARTFTPGFSDRLKMNSSNSIEQLTSQMQDLKLESAERSKPR